MKSEDEIRQKIHEYQKIIDNTHAQFAFEHTRIDRRAHQIAALNWVLTGKMGLYREQLKEANER